MIEKVWKAEQAVKKEQEKHEERMKELAAERQLQEMKDLQASSGLISKSSAERMDWMYAGAPKTNHEDYLLGKEKKLDFKDEDVKKLNDKQVPGSLMLNKAPTAASVAATKEAAIRLREDPMMTIMRAEQVRTYV